MTTRKILATLVTVLFSMNCFAAMNKAEAAKRLSEQNKSEVTVAESFKKAFEEAKGDMKKLTLEQKKAFSTAISAIASKVGVKSTALQRIFLIKSDILADVIRLEDTLRTGTAEQKEAAKAQLDLIENIGTKLDASNYRSVEVQAAVKLLQLDLTTLPAKATEVVKAVNENIRQGKDLVEATKEATKGIKGTLEDLIKCV
ncbi:MAG: hypothetical protein IPM97_04215 [Bdellovibrionaceae bacterium]|nr:hypothetical protein [Pseudobdellovibrionaceae bacterium]